MKIKVLIYVNGSTVRYVDEASRTEDELTNRIRAWIDGGVWVRDPEQNVIAVIPWLQIRLIEIERSPTNTPPTPDPNAYRGGD